MSLDESGLESSIVSGSGEDVAIRSLVTDLDSVRQRLMTSSEHTSSSRDIARMIQVVAQVLPAVDAPFEFGVKTDLLLERTAGNAVYQGWDSNGSRCWVDLRVMPDVED